MEHSRRQPLLSRAFRSPSSERPGQAVATRLDVPRSRVRQMMLAACALAMVGGGTASAAAEPCGGLKVQEGIVSFGDRLTLEAVAGADGEACLKAVAAELTKRTNLQGVTIAARVPNDKAMRDKGNVAANLAADRLASFGIERRLISTVVPMARPDEKDALYIAFVERRSARSVAQVQTVSGRVFAGHQLGNLRDTTPGALLTTNDYLETGKGSVVLLKLLDGTYIYVFEDSALRIGQVDVEADGRRNVRVQLVRGEAAVIAAEREGPFYLLTGNAIAGVRGTTFRLAQIDAQKSRVETLAGTVTFGGKNANLFVPDGKGSRVDYKGIPEDPRPLLSSPLPEWPLMGTAEPGDLLRWEPVDGAQSYRVEIAANAQFTKSWMSFESTQEKLPISEVLTPGKWFWRVTGRDVDGFVGYPSKIYAFIVRPPGLRR